MANKSKTYLLPLLNEYIEIRNVHLIEDTFINFPDIKDEENYIGLLYKKEPSKRFEEMFIDYETSDFLREYRLVDDEKIMFIFIFPEEFNDDYVCFKEGLYSKISGISKNIIIEFTKDTYKYEPIVVDLVDILYKRENRKAILEKQLQMSIPDDVELSSKIDIKEETYG